MQKIEVKGKVLVPLRWMVVQYYCGNLSFPPDYSDMSRTAPVIQGMVFDEVEKVKEGSIEGVPMYILIDSKTGQKDYSSVHSLGESLFARRTDMVDPEELDDLNCFQVTVGGIPLVNVENPVLLEEGEGEFRSNRVLGHNKAMMKLLGRRNMVIIRDLTCNPYLKYSATRSAENLSKVFSADYDDGDWV